jgi:biopolymer transport protein ExbB/TolQ
MRMHAKESNLSGATWGLPLIGLFGTIAGMLFAVGRMGTEPEWKTALEAVGFSLGVVGISLIVLMPAVRSRRELLRDCVSFDSNRRIPTPHTVLQGNWDVT